MHFQIGLWYLVTKRLVFGEGTYLSWHKRVARQSKCVCISQGIIVGKARFVCSVNILDLVKSFQRDWKLSFTIFMETHVAIEY